MNVLERKVESQVQFWSLLGPFVILLTTAILLFKVSNHWYFPFSALVGIPLCVKWKMKGMAIALSTLFILSTIAYQSLSLDERYWHVGMALAIAFSLIILTLSYEEVESLIEKLQLESQSRLDNFQRLGESWKETEQIWLQEKLKLTTELKSISHESIKTHEEKQTFYKLAQLAGDELVQVKAQHERMIQEIFYKKQQIAQLNERVEETELTIQELLNTESQKKIQSLTDKLLETEESVEILKAKLHMLRGKA